MSATSRAGAVALAFVATIGLATVLYLSIGQAAAALTFIPVALTGALYGARAGGIVGGIVAILNAATMYAVGVLGIGLAGFGQVGLGTLAFAALGVISGALHDMRERATAQTGALERELLQRREYTDVLAHELRNPLVAIRAASRVRQPDADSLLRVLDAVRQEAERAISLLDSLTDASSIESGRMRSVLRTIDIAGAVRRTAEAMQDSEHPLHLSLPDMAVPVRADEERIAQVVRNLLSNASKYSPPGTPIDVTVGVATDGRSAIVQVRDYGAGIPPSERGRLFERFTRLSTAGATPGSGLGLWISRSLIRDHGGDLLAEWPSGGGTQFVFTIPLASV